MNNLLMNNTYFIAFQMEVMDHMKLDLKINLIHMDMKVK